jgi:hypothetical protein
MENTKVKQKQSINNPQNNQINSINQNNQINPINQNNQINQPKQNKQKNIFQLNKKLSQKKIKKDNKINFQSKQKIKINNEQASKVMFKLKNNYTEKFYCPQMAISKITKSQNINLESIPDLPEIPLDTLFGNQ